MAETSTVSTFPAPFVEAAGQTFLEQLQSAIGYLQSSGRSSADILWSTICS